MKCTGTGHAPKPRRGCLRLSGDRRGMTAIFGLDYRETIRREWTDLDGRFVSHPTR